MGSLYTSVHQGLDASVKQLHATNNTQCKISAVWMVRRWWSRVMVMMMGEHSYSGDAIGCCNWLGGGHHGV